MLHSNKLNCRIREFPLENIHDCNSAVKTHLTNPMFSKSVVLTLLLSLGFVSIAQQKNRQQVLDEKKNSLEKIMATFSGKPESFDEMIKKGNDGLAVTTEKEYAYKFLFLHAIGTGYYYKQDFKSAIENFEQAYSEAVKGNMIEKSTKPLGNLVSIYHYMGLQEKADSAALQLKLLAETIDTLKNKSDIYYNLGLYNQQQKFYYSIALDNFLKSAELHKPVADTAKTIKLKTDYGTRLMMVAEIYLNLKQPIKALQYLEEIKPFLNLSKVVDISAYGKFIRSYVQLYDRTKALKYYNLLHQTAKTSPGKWSELVSSNLEMASLALKDKDYLLAKSYIGKADKQSRLDNKEILTSTVSLSYGDYYKAIGDYDQALHFYKAAEHGSSVYNKEQYADLLRSLTAVEILAGNQNAAAATFNKFVNLSDSLTNRKISLNIAEMEAVYQNKNKEQQIATKSIQLFAARKQLIGLITGLSLLILVAVLLIIIYRNKKKAEFSKGMAELEMKALRSQMNPHFIFNSLNSIQKYIWENKQEDASEYLTKFARLIRLVLENSLHQSVRLSEELDALRLYIEMEHRRNNQKFDYSITVDKSIDAETTFIPPLLLQPYVENAIWHGLSQKDGRGNLLISLKQKENLLLCQIDDDGIGRTRSSEIKTQTKNKTSLAMNISSQRIAWLKKDSGIDASVEITDNYSGGEATGTSVLLTLPHTYN